MSLREACAPGIALARLLLGGASPEEIMEICAADPVLSETARQHGHALARLRRMLDDAAIHHNDAATPEQIAAVFDRAAAVAPDAGCALYALDDPALLETATAEIILWLEARGLLASPILDLGCGSGRIAAALEGRARVLGVEVSGAMASIARGRCENAAFVIGNGRNLAFLPDAQFGLVLAVDSFPYLVQAGIAEQHVAEAARVLKPGGTLTILNFSYRDDAALDRREAAEWTERYGLALQLAGVSPFALWDAAAFVAVREPDHASGSRHNRGGQQKGASRVAF